MITPRPTRGLWLRTRQDVGAADGEVCLLVYDVDSFSDPLISNDLKQVLELRARTANVYLLAPFKTSEECREELRSGAAVLRAASYSSQNFGKIYLLEMLTSPESREILVTACLVQWDFSAGAVRFQDAAPLGETLRAGWLFDLFDSQEGLVVAPRGVHFKKSSSRHADTFLRAANVLTSSEACGLLAFFALATLGRIQPKRVFVDTSPLLSLAYVMMSVARTQGIFEREAPARSFSSYGGQSQLGRLSGNDVVLISATTSGGLQDSLVQQGAHPECVVTLYFLSSGKQCPKNVLCDLTSTEGRSLGYPQVKSYPAQDCPLCALDFLLAELEGDQFLLQKRQHRLLRITQTTQTQEARQTLTELKNTRACETVLRPDSMTTLPLDVRAERLLEISSIRSDFIRLLRRYCPHPLALVVTTDITSELFLSLVGEANLSKQISAARVIDWTQIGAEHRMTCGDGVLVIFGTLASHTQARQINASLRGIVDKGNVSYLAALTLAETPREYQDLKMFLGYGERGPDTFTFRDARRLALPSASGERNAWSEELALLNSFAIDHDLPEFEVRRMQLSMCESARDDVFLPGKSSPLSIQRDFVFLDTSEGTDGISQTDVFAVVSHLLAVARSHNQSIAKNVGGRDAPELVRSVYGHVLLDPGLFMTFNDAILRASFLRAARRSELAYDVDQSLSQTAFEFLDAELSGWEAGTGDALPEILVALATKRLRLFEVHQIEFRNRALRINLPPHLRAIAAAIAP